MARQDASGFTIIELVVVVAILAALAGLVVPMLGASTNDSQYKATKVNLSHVRDVIMGSPELPGYNGDMGELPEIMADLLMKPATASDYNRNTRRGWRGPYINNSSGTYTLDFSRGFTPAYGLAGDPAILDSWGNPLVIQKPLAGTDAEQSLFTRIVSAGPDGIINTPINLLYPELSDRGDDIVIFLRRADAP